MCAPERWTVISGGFFTQSCSCSNWFRTRDIWERKARTPKLEVVLFLLFCVQKVFSQNNYHAVLPDHYVYRHFQMKWTFVEPNTPIKSGVKFCVCVKEFLPWLMMPLQVVYVNENKTSGKMKASYCFGSGTLQGHLLVSISFFSAAILVFSLLIWC